MKEDTIGKIAELQYEAMPFQDFVDRLETILETAFSFAELKEDLFSAYSSPHYMNEIDRSDHASSEKLIQYLSVRLRNITDEPVISHGLPHVAVKCPHVVCWAKIRDQVLGVVTYQIQHVDLTPMELNVYKIATRAIAQSYYMDQTLHANPRGGEMLTNLLEGRMEYYYRNLSLKRLGCTTYLAKLKHAQSVGAEIYPYILMNCRSRFDPIDVCQYHDAYYMLLDASKGRQIQAELEAFCRTHQLECVISSVLEDPLMIHDVYEMMERIAHPLDQSVMCMADHILPLLLTQTKLTYSQIKRMIADEYLAIKQYDQANGTDFLGTVLTYIRLNQNAVLTAKAQFIHANTVTYRVSRMAELFDLDYTDQRMIKRLLLSAEVDKNNME